MRIVIATGIYPPEIGGPAQYALNLSQIWAKKGYKTSVHVFSRFLYLPSGIRHLVYFFSILYPVFQADFILALDTYSCALPALIASKIFGKKIILRTGGDFLWEAYVERTGDLALLREFYETRMDKLSSKERIIFSLTGFILRNVDAIIWSTEWQEKIFMRPYKLEDQRNFIVENYYGPKEPGNAPKNKNFIAFTRKLKWKHIDFLKRIFSMPDVMESKAILDVDKTMSHTEFMDTIKDSYAVIIASLGDISPNTILDAIRFNKPFILTKETGLLPRLEEVGLFVDPKNENDVAEKIIWLSEPSNYQKQVSKISSFTFTHGWEEISDEYIGVYKSIKS